MSAPEFFNQMRKSLRAETNTCLIGRVENFDPVKMKADVQPLVLDEKGEQLPMLVDVPVQLFRAGGFIIRPPYTKGDLVYVACAQHDIDDVIMTGRVSNQANTRQHDLTDAVVIGGLHPFSEDLPAAHSEDMLIATESMSAKIVITKDGSINLEAEEKPIGITAPKGISLSATDPEGVGVTITGKSSVASW